MSNSIQDMKEKIAYFMRRLYVQGLTTTSGGNISARLPDSTVLITPSASDKAQMKGEEIGHMTMDGNIIGLHFKPSIESFMHLEIYKARPDVNSIVHAHPVHASAFAASKVKISSKYLAESYTILGEIAYPEYHRMGSMELAMSVADSLKKTDCAIMRNHGAIAIGNSLLEAFDKLEVLEAAARITCINMGVLKDFAVELDEKELKEIDLFINRKI